MEYYLFSRSYHADEDDHLFKISKSEYEELKPFEDDLMLGNYPESNPDHFEELLSEINERKDLAEDMTRKEFDKFLRSKKIIELANC